MSVNGNYHDISLPLRITLFIQEIFVEYLLCPGVAKRETKLLRNLPSWSPQSKEREAAFFVLTLWSKLLLTRKGVERITTWVCRYVVPPCNKSCSACGYDFWVSTALFVVALCFFFISFQSNSVTKSQPHSHTPVPQIRSFQLPTFCSCEPLCSVWEHRPDQQWCKSGQSSLFASKNDNWGDFNLTLLRQNQSILVSTDQYQKVAWGVMMYLWIGRSWSWGGWRGQKWVGAIWGSGGWPRQCLTCVVRAF